MTETRGTRSVVPEQPPPDRQAEPAAAELDALMTGQLEVTSDLRERVKALETESKHYATKADLANAKVWALAGIATGLLSLAIALTIALLRLLAALGEGS